jgi:hypothetical protein
MMKSIKLHTEETLTLGNGLTQTPVTCGHLTSMSILNSFQTLVDAS